MARFVLVLVLALALVVVVVFVLVRPGYSLMDMDVDMDIDKRRAVMFCSTTAMVVWHVLDISSQGKGMYVRHILRFPTRIYASFDAWQGPHGQNGRAQQREEKPKAKIARWLSEHGRTGDGDGGAQAGPGFTY